MKKNRFRDLFMANFYNKTYREVEKITGMNKAVIAQVRRNEFYAPTLKTCKQIAKALNMDSRTLWLIVAEDIYDNEENHILRPHN